MVAKKLSKVDGLRAMREANAGSIVGTGPSSPQDYADLITTEWRKSVEGIIGAGRWLTKAKKALDHGELGELYEMLPFSDRTARRLMTIAASDRISNRTPGSDLPASWHTLYQLAKLTDEQWAVVEPALRPDMERSHIKRLLRPQATTNGPVPPGSVTLVEGDIQEVELGYRVDVIITDPPYGREHLDCYSWLADFAVKHLKPGGSLLAMSGQSYLPEIMATLGAQLTYHWTCAYLTPGGQAAQLWDRNVNTFWKPVLWYTSGPYAGLWVGDVLKSDTNDNDKRFHEWGQSESGMADLVSRFSAAGDLVCDPFAGGGTTLAVAAALGRQAVGVEVDGDAIATLRERLAV